MYGLRLLIDVDAHQLQHEVLEGESEILEMVGVEHGIHSRVEVRENDAEERHLGMHIALLAEGLDAVDRVQRDPADHEEEHNDRQILCGLHIALPCCPQHTQHGASVTSASGWSHLYLGRGRATTEIRGGIHGHNLANLKRD